MALMIQNVNFITEFRLNSSQAITEKTNYLKNV